MSSMGTIVVRSGGSQHSIPVVDGASVADVRDAIASTFGLEEGTQVFVTRGTSVNPVTDEVTTRVFDGDTVEFMKPSGRKG